MSDRRPDGLNTFMVGTDLYIAASEKMTTLSRVIGILLLILLGYHYVNEPVGFSVAGSIATGIFAICLTMVYQAYQPEGKNWIGWIMIVVGCLVLAAFDAFSLFLFVPIALIVVGYRFADLPLEFKSYDGGGGSGGGSFGDGFGGDSGAGGD